VRSPTYIVIRGRLQEVARETFRVLGVLTLIDAPVFAAIHAASPAALVNLSTLVLIIEAGILLIIGGLVDLTSSIFFGKLREHVFKSSEAWTFGGHKESQMKALPYVLAGFIVLGASIVLSILA
jgi:hypothetical protein